MYNIELKKFTHSNSVKLNIYKMNGKFSLELFESVSYSDDDLYSTILEEGKKTKKELTEIQKEVFMYLHNNGIVCKMNYVNLD